MAIAHLRSKSTQIDARGSTQVARRLVFTREHIDRLPPPHNGQRAYYYDAKVRGLALAVSPAGKKVFVLYRKINGRPERITIGPYVDMSIDKARRRAEEMNGKIADGKNPAADRRRLNAESTLGDLFEKFLNEYAREHKKTWNKDVSMFNKHLASWRLRKLSVITKADVQSLHARIGRTCGPYAANRTIELLSSMFSQARNHEWWDGANPAERVKSYRERKRDRFLQPEELPRFFQALMEEENRTIRDYLLVSLCTGARRANVQAMHWADVNLERCLWRIPETKSGESVLLPLSPMAVRVLESRRDMNPNGYVFPGRGKTGHLIEPKTAWARILKRAGIANLWIHDLRRTLGSWQAAMGASLPIIGKSLGHQPGSPATAVYAQLNVDPVRQSVNAANEALFLAAPRGLLGSK
jgi:integrase